MAIFGEASRVFIAGFILTVVSFLIQLIGFATPYWDYLSIGDSTSYGGLWVQCSSYKDKSKCNSIKCDDKYVCSGNFAVARYMASLSFGMLLAAVVIIALKMFVLKEKPLIRATVVFCVVAGTCALIATIAYGTDDAVVAEHLNFSFAFYIIAAAGSYLSGCLLLVGK